LAYLFNVICGGGGGGFYFIAFLLLFQHPFLFYFEKEAIALGFVR